MGGNVQPVCVSKVESYDILLVDLNTPLSKDGKPKDYIYKHYPGDQVDKFSF